MGEPAANKESSNNRAANAANHGALRKVSSRVIGLAIPVEKANGLTDGSSPKPTETLPEEPFSALIAGGRVVETPFDLLTLSMLMEHSSELGQCIEAMETNIDSHGHRFISRVVKDITPQREESDAKEDAPKEPKETPEQAAARAEYARLTNFFTYCTDESFTQFRRRMRKDLEATGNAYFEVIRAKDGQIQGFTHIPSYQVRLGRMDDEAILSTRKILELQEDGTSVKIKEQAQWRRFRKFVQSRAIHRRTLHTIEGYKVRWFKEYGDPRRMSKTNGDYETDGRKVEDTDLANEVLHLKLYSPRTPYGLPRYIGNLLSIFGDRASEEINYTTFRNNNIPSMVVLVSNGQLTDGTIDRIQAFVNSQVQGSDNYSKFLIIEGEPIADEGEDGGQVKVDIKPLTNDQHKDALFQNYSKNNQDKVRRAFRLPPIFVGRSDDYTRSTAESSRRLADEQVFAPERDEFDNIINRLIFPEMGIIYHKFRSNSPNTTDNAQLVAILAGAEKTGGMTPRIARRVLEEVLGAELPELPADFPADVPFSLTMAEAVKNQADASEPGQQVTAIKALKDLGIIGDDGSLDLTLDATKQSMEEVTKRLITLNNWAEAQWKAQQGATVSE